MANTKSALKALRKSERKRVRNRIVVSSTRTFLRRARTALEDGTPEEAQSALQEAIRALDKAAVKGVLHRNNAARRKSRLMKLYHSKLQPAA